MNQNAAEEILYGEGARDFTQDGYLEAIARVRRQDRKLASQVERALKDLLGRMFPRRQLPWTAGTVGIGYRLVLLPNDPYFRRDVEEVRKALGIPEDQVRSTSETPIFIRIQSVKGMKNAPEVVADRWLAAEWILYHETVANRLPPQPPKNLTIEAVRSAGESASLQPRDVQGAEWLRQEAADTRQCNVPDSPLHRFTARLLERHRLPHRLCQRMMVHILTLRDEDLADLEPFSVKFSEDSFLSSEPGAFFSVTIGGLDEYTTKKDWDRLWADHVLPRQKRLWELRGGQPQGRRAPGLERLKSALPLYRFWLRTGSVEVALNQLQGEGKPGGEIDTETARRVISDLDDLLRPR